MVSGPGTVTFADANAASTTATFSVAGTYTLQLLADDSALTATDACTITVNPVNTAPTVNAGGDQTITLPDGATLSGTVSDDGLPNPPGAVTVTWSMQSGPGTVTFADANAASTTATFSVAGTYTLQLLADDSALTATDTMVITVNPANTAPTVDAGQNQTITLPTDTVNLDGMVNDDGWPNPPAAVTVTWSKVSGPGTVTFGDASATDTTATFSTDGTYVLQLLADDYALTATDTCTVTVNPASPPPANDVQLTYLGAFKISGATNVYGGDLTFYPSGDNGAGSLFISRGTVNNDPDIYEVAIPTLVDTSDINSLNSVAPLHGFDCSTNPAGMVWRSTDDKLYYSNGGTDPAWRSINRDGSSESAAQTTQWGRVGVGICQIPDAWANSYAGGKNLLAVGNLYGICIRSADPWNNSMTTPTPLVEYNSNYPMNGYASNDTFSGIAWVSVSGQDNIIVSGKDASAPAATLWFYNAADVAGAANLYDPQPYKTLAVQDHMFNSQVLSGLAYDATNQILYGYEGAYGAPTVVHAWALSTADVTAPAAVADLAEGSETSAAVTLSWTAPGDDDNTGTATAYDIRYSTSTITQANWDAATQVTSEPTPAAASSNESMVVSGLSPSTTYYFAIKTVDEASNWSSLSNVASATTLEPAVNLAYLGAFKISGATNVYGGDLTFYPSGDNGAGSLFISRGTVNNDPDIYEVAIPTLVDTSDINSLNSVAPLHGFDCSTNPAGMVWRSTDDKLYYSNGGTDPAWRSINRDGSSESAAQTTQWGRVGVGICQIPDAWANSYAGGKNLLAVGNLYGICIRSADPWNNSMTTPTPLVEYNSNYPMNGYASNDTFSGIAWVSVSGQDNIIVSGKDASAPAATLWFYNAADVAGAANLYDPQPYKTLAVQDHMFNSQVLSGLAYDATNQILYGYEGAYGAPTVVHAWALSAQ